jgi:pimeloyl-ACP methyl ester carboxylesterase
MTTVAVGGILAEVEGDGFPVVMVHGLGGTSNAFQPQIEGLRGYRVIRIDLPGSGRSALPPDALAMAGFVEAVVAVVRILGIEKAHFVAHSLGTIVCQALAAERPALVRSLVLLGALAEPAEATRAGLAGRAELARREGMAPIADQIVANALSASTRATQPAAVAFVRESLMRQSPEGYARTCEALARAEAADPRLIAAPALLLTGDADAVNPPGVARALADRIAGAKFAAIDRGGHWLMIEKPAETNRWIAEFLKQAEH